MISTVTIKGTMPMSLKLMDIIDDRGYFIKYENLTEHYMLSFIQYREIMAAVPISW